MDYFYDNIMSRSHSAENPRTSRYRKLARLVDDEEQQYIEVPDDIQFPERPDDTYHVVTQKDSNRLDLVANQYYGNPLLYWIIAIASGIDDPMNVPPGTTLRIPSKQYLYGYKGVLV